MMQTWTKEVPELVEGGDGFQRHWGGDGGGGVSMTWRSAEY